ncbi:MAG: hypothetical protein HKN87_01135 [Saprospiraceae bacterium]|nr:hypothetical protein [Saprospiraceae bacterium]
MIRYVFLLLSFSAISSVEAQNGDPGLTFHTDFEAASLGEISKLNGNHWQMALTGESDSDDRNRQVSWYYFRVEGAKDRPLRLTLSDLVGEYNYRKGSHAITSETRPMISYDQKHWTHLPDSAVSWDEQKVQLTFTLLPDRDTIWIAHQPPYTTENLLSLLKRYEYHPAVKKMELGKTVEQRSMPLLSITDHSVNIADKKVVWIMARQHSWESGTSWLMEGLVHHLLESEQGTELLKKMHFQLFPMGDPDGVARGGVRFNTHGHDLNRNWDLVKPVEMPEIHLQKKAIREWLEENHPIDLFITLHNTERADYIQGPDLPVGHGLWEEMVGQTSFESTEGVREMPLSTTPGKPGRMTVNQALWAEMNIPAYLMELKVEAVDKIDGRRGVEDWLELGRGLLEAIDKSLR